MHIGLGLYRQMLKRENYRFAKQAGCTHIVAHYLRYTREIKTQPDEGGSSHGGKRARATSPLWTEEELGTLKAEIEAEGLTLAALENFEPAHWHDVLLDGPRRDEQIENIKEIIRRAGRVGIPVIGYYFSLAGVWGHVEGPYARGGAVSVGFLGPDGPQETPIPRGQVWNMVYDPDAGPGDIGTVTSEQMWDRLRRFLKEVVPVAEQAGVRLAAHPDDPPMPALRGTGRMIYQPHYYQRLLDLVPSRHNALELCAGTIQEMTEGSIYDAIDTYSRQKAIAYLHLRNVRGKVPSYRETFIDEGDFDVVKILRILHRNQYDGVIIPDHTPMMSCDAPWHAGMAYALGYIRACLRRVQEES